MAAEHHYSGLDDGQRYPGGFFKGLRNVDYCSGLTVYTRVIIRIRAAIEGDYGCEKDDENVYVVYETSTSSLQYMVGQLRVPLRRTLIQQATVSQS